MHRYLPFLSLLLLVGCASPARTATLIHNGEFLRLEGDRAMEAGATDKAAVAYAKSFRQYLECREMAAGLLAREGSSPDPRLLAFREEACDALPKVALLVAGAHAEMGLRCWRRADREFDREGLGEALAGYRHAHLAYNAEERWLRRAHTEIGLYTGSGREDLLAAIAADLEQATRDRLAIHENLNLTIQRIREQRPDIALEILDGFLTGLNAMGVVLEYTAIVFLEIISEPVFWEFFFRACAGALECFCKH